MAARIIIEIDEATLKMLVVGWLEKQIGAEIDETEVTIETKSKQNYKSEWESAAFRAKIEKMVSE